MVSIILCTYNRVDSLRQVLDDLARITPPVGHEVEILVVDNNSTDATAALVKAQNRCDPFPLRYILETNQGLSHARNRGIREAGGDWIVFTDDDVRIEPDWLAALISRAEASGAPAVGGRVLPIWPATVPRWVATEGPFVQQGVFLHYDRGDHPRLLDAQDPEPFGCNMAFRAELFRAYGLFRTDLGRTGSRLLAGEDTEMFCRLRTAGKPICYAPDAVVHHPVEAKRLSLGYLVRWQFWGNVSEARAQPVYTGRTLGRVPLYIFRQLMTAGGKCLLYGVRGDRLASAYHLGKLSAGIGSLCGIWFGRSQTGPEKPSLPDKADPSVSPGSLI